MTPIIVSIAILFFAFRTFFFAIGLKKMRSFKIGSKSKVKVSILIPARNEEKNLTECLESLVRSDYPNEQIQLIVINDRSTDNTQKIADSFAKKFNFIEVLNIESDEQKEGIKGKAGAIHQGMKIAKNEYILLTDADCTVEPTWIGSVAQIFEKEEADMVASFSVIKAHSLFDKLQELQWLYMNCMASGSTGNNFLLGCYGNNQSFRKNKYFEVGGYKQIGFSVTEDLALLQSFNDQGYKITYPCDRKLLVWTKPIAKLSDYFKQLHRWTRGGKDLGYKAVLFVITSFSIWLAALGSLINGDFFYFFFTMIARLIFDSILMLPALTKLGLLRIRKFIIVGVPFLLILELISPIMLLKRSVSWKGQTFK